MTDDHFWHLLAQARGGSAASADPDALKAVLAPLTDAELLDFGVMFYGKVCDLNDWRLWGAGYVIAGGMSDDSFHYFRTWIVGKGREVFEVARTNPDELGPFIDDTEVDNESLEYVTIEMLEERGSEVDPREVSGRDADGDTAGEPFEEDSVHAGYPKLAARFG